MTGADEISNNFFNVCEKTIWGMHIEMVDGVQTIFNPGYYDKERTKPVLERYIGCAYPNDTVTPKGE